MIGKIINFAYNLLGKIPIIKNFISPNANRISFEEQQKFHKLVQENDNKEYVHLESNRNKNIINGLQNFLKSSKSSRKLTDKLENFDKLFDFYIEKKNNDQIIEIKEKNILNDVQQYQNLLIESFKTKLDELNNKQFDKQSHEKYINLWSDFIVENKRLIIEIEEEVIERISKIENSNDLDLMKGLQIAREISKQISNKTLNVCAESINELPLGFEIEGEKEKTSLREFIKKTLNQDYQILYFSSKFGMHSNELIKKIFANIDSNKNKNGKELFENLIIITRLQETIQGSILQEREKLESSDYQIGMLKPEIIQELFEKIANLNFSIVNLKAKFIKKEEYDKKKIEIVAEMKNIKDFIYKAGLVENYINIDINKNERNEVLKNFGINLNEFEKTIKNIYGKINWLNKYLGEMQKEDIEGIEFKSVPIINLFNFESDDRIDQFKRIILETSLLAGIEVILKDQKLFDTKKDFTKNRFSKDGKVLPATKNFDTIPWLKNFYKQRLEYYENVCKKENSAFKIGAVIKEISKIGKELHKTKFFSSSNFFERYGIEKEGSQLNNLIGVMTNVGRMSLNLDYVSHFLASIDPEENENIDPNVISNLDSIINYLSKESKIYDKDGNEIFAPLKTEDNIRKKYDHLESIVGSRDFLALNTPIIVEFLRKTFGKDTPDSEPIEKESFYAKNQVLSTWLYYILVKFLPKHSNDSESLKARIMVFDQLIDQNFQNKAKFTSELYRKIIRKARGLNDLDQPSNKNRGVIKELCADLEKHIEWHIANKNESKIDLKLLLECYEHVQQSLINNPRARIKLEKIQKELFKNNEDILKPLEKYLIHLYNKNPLIVINFIKQNRDLNPHYKNQFCLDLLSKIESNIYKIKKFKKEIDIIDSDENKIKEMINILEDLTYLGYALSSLEQNSIKLTSKLFNLSDKNLSNKVEKQIETIVNFINSTVNLIENSQYPAEVELFKNQFNLKNKLKTLISKSYFSFKPKNNSRFLWTKDQAIKTLTA